MNCPKCGKQIPDNAEVCSYCNAVVTTDTICDMSQTAVITAPPKTSGLAIASLILGIVSVILSGIGFLPLAIIGLVLGITAKKRIRCQPDQILAIGGIITSILGLGLGLVQIIIGNGRIIGYDSAQCAQCFSQLENISRSLAAYSNTNDNTFPPSLKILVDTMNLTPNNLICPGQKVQKKECCYIYRGNDLTAASPADMILAYDKFDNHHGEARNVLYAGYNVERIEEADFPQAIDHDNELRRQLGLPEKPLEEPQVLSDEE